MYIYIKMSNYKQKRTPCIVDDLALAVELVVVVDVASMLWLINISQMAPYANAT